MSEEKKPKCSTKRCPKTSQYDIGDSKVCVGCIKDDSRKHASHKRMELQILSDITRGVKKSLPHMELTMSYDVVYHDKKRPDLLITNDFNKNIVMVEVDEKQHFTIDNLKKDDIRFKNFYEEAIDNEQLLSVVRVVPGENTKTSMFKTDKVSGQTKLKRTNGYIEKNSENYNKYIKESVNKIVRIIGDKQSVKHKGYQVSVGPTIEKNPVSPIFSDTSSPDVSPSVSRARAIITKKPSVEKNSRSPDVPATTSRVRPIITNISPLKSPYSRIFPRRSSSIVRERDAEESISPPRRYYSSNKRSIFRDLKSPKGIITFGKANNYIYKNIPGSFVRVNRSATSKKSLSPPPLPKKTTPPRKKSFSPPPMPNKASPLTEKSTSSLDEEVGYPISPIRQPLSPNTYDRYDLDYYRQNSPSEKSLSPPQLPKKISPPRKKSLSPPRSKEVVFPRRNRAESPKAPEKTIPSKKSLSPVKKSTGFFSFLGF